LGAAAIAAGDGAEAAFSAGDDDATFSEVGAWVGDGDGVGELAGEAEGDGFGNVDAVAWGSALDAATWLSRRSRN